MLCLWFEKQNDPKWPWPEMTHFHGRWNLFYARLDDNQLLSLPYHTQNCTLKVTQKMAKYNHYYRIITQKTRKKPLKQDKITILLHFSELSKHQILLQSSIFSISLVFNLIPNQNKFLCYRILQFLNKTKRESFLQKASRKTRSEPGKWGSEGNFHTLRMAKMRGKMRVFCVKNKEIRK